MHSYLSVQRVETSIQPGADGTTSGHSTVGMFQAGDSLGLALSKRGRQVWILAQMRGRLLDVTSRTNRESLAQYAPPSASTE
jgi:hypothetical protein